MKRHHHKQNGIIAAANKNHEVYTGRSVAAIAQPNGANTAPIQRTKWIWSEKDEKWNPKNPKKVYSFAPWHKGEKDGEEYDDKIGSFYKQSKDKTVTPFLRSGESFMGEKGIDKQRSGKKPLASDIRVNAHKPSELRGGAGLHEILPTNERGDLDQDEALIGIQSGMRTSTALTLLRREPESDEEFSEDYGVGAHTGFAPKSSGRGSTHTKGQSKAHDRLRKKLRRAKKQKKPATKLNTMLLGHIETQPLGQEILEDPYLEDMNPSLKSIGEIGPVESDDEEIDPSRLKLAQELHDRREKVKRRTRSLKRVTDRGRSPSPPRSRIRDSGKGGGYLKEPQLKDLVEFVPKFKGKKDSYKRIANMSAWATQPQRMGFVDDIPSPPPIKKRPRLPSNGSSNPVKKKKKTTN